MGEQHLNALSVTTRLLERWGRGQRAGNHLIAGLQKMLTPLLGRPEENHGETYQRGE